MFIAVIKIKLALVRSAMCRPMSKPFSNRRAYLNMRVPYSKGTWHSSGARLIRSLSTINIPLLRSEEGLRVWQKALTRLTAGFLSLLIFFPSLAQTTSSVSDIDSYTTEVDRLVKTKQPRVFADISTEGDEKAKWKEFTNNKVLEDTTWYQAANVYSRHRKTIVAKLTFTSPSGDWYHFVDYYFRDDGSLAKIHARLNTFYGNISVVRNRYYDSSGRLIKSTRRFQDVKTDKLVKSAPGDFIDEPIPLFKTVAALPFHRLL